jgi:hypothetical protein
MQEWFLQVAIPAQSLHSACTSKALGENPRLRFLLRWIPASAGMTDVCVFIRVWFKSALP